MTTRTHLSISEVMTLLSDDFPDLTITKIRYLESQGLIAPERTASGYRKFYDADIERLRWVLRQQRENFLPLKVIKRRLDRIDGSSEDPEPEDEPAQAALDLGTGAADDDPPPVWMADHAKAAKSEPQREPVADQDQKADAVAVSAQADTGHRVQPGGPRGNHVPASQRPATGDPMSEPVNPKTGAATTSSRTKDREERTSSTRVNTGAPPTTNAPGAETSDVSMTRAEFLHATGLGESQLSQLESFGIVTATDGVDAELYGATAVICGRQAATLLAAGIEARHLRAYKVAADREAGLFEQLLLPLLRQRNPASRAEAMKTLNQVVGAGAAIHSALLRQSLQGLLRSGR